MNNRDLAFFVVGAVYAYAICRVFSPPIKGSVVAAEDYWKRCDEIDALTRWINLPWYKRLFTPCPTP